MTDWSDTLHWLCAGAALVLVTIWLVMVTSPVWAMLLTALGVIR